LMQYSARSKIKSKINKTGTDVIRNALMGALPLTDSLLWHVFLFDFCSRSQEPRTLTTTDIQGLVIGSQTRWAPTRPL
jgi:hypothetical protein